MAPVLSVANVRNSSSINAVLPRKRTDECPARYSTADFQDGGFSEFGMWVRDTYKSRWLKVFGSQDDVASLGIHINRIVAVCSQKQMLRINAGWSIALVQNTKARRDGSVFHFVRNAVRQLFGNRSTGPKKAIPFIVFIRLPQPAIRPLFNLGPKSLCGSAAVSNHDGAIMGKPVAPVNMGVP